MRIVIVEDEVRSREGLCRLIGRISKDYVVVGEAENGVQGLDLIRKTNPDLLIIDICMAEMNGLAMLDSLKQSGISVKVVIVSAYSKFAFAQQAIKLGVDDYLVKPITVEELTEVLKKISKRLVEERTAMNTHPQALGTLENILSGLLAVGIEMDEQLCAFVQNRYAIDVDGEFILVPIYLGHQYEQCHEGIAGQLIENFQSLPDGRFCLLKLPEDRQLLGILYSFEDARSLTRWFEQLVRKYYRGTYCFGWICFKKLREMRKNLGRIQKCMHWSIVLGEGCIIPYTKVSAIHTVPFMYPIAIENRMCSAICAGDEDRIKTSIQEFKALFTQGTLFSPQSIKETVTRFLGSVINLIREVDFDKYSAIKQMDLSDKVNGAIMLHELEELLENLLFALLHRRNEKNAPTVSLIVQRAKRLAQEFYPTGITLDEIAVKLGISPEYLSTQFRKEMGINFNTYIKGLRIGVAKELLIGTDLKLYEIAERIGYGSPKYFSYIFREVTGKLPTAYRKLHR